MTYCLAMRLDEGLVSVADTRTNAGVDNVGTYRKMHVLSPTPDRLFVLESAGNLATTQQVLDRIRQDLETPGDHMSLATVTHLFDAALYIGRLGQQVQQEHSAALGGMDASATFILGGQVGPEAPDILMVYPEGNYIRASDERPFLQIGESKYGKFMLELAVEAHVDMITATKIALSSMISTASSNLSVGPPYDIGLYRPGTHELEELRVEDGSPVLHELQSLWNKHLLHAIADLPTISRQRLTEPAAPTDAPTAADPDAPGAPH